MQPSASQEPIAERHTGSISEDEFPLGSATAQVDEDETGSGRDVPGRSRHRSGGLGRYLPIRFLLIFPTIFILMPVVFFLMRVTGDPITAAMGGRLPADQLVTDSLVVALVIGVPLGMFADCRRDRWPDAVLRVFATLGYATPVFFIGLLLKLVFSVRLGWLPDAGRVSTNGGPTTA